MCNAIGRAVAGYGRAMGRSSADYLQAIGWHRQAKGGCRAGERGAKGHAKGGL